MKTIYKYSLKGASTSILIHKDAEIIHCGNHNGEFCIWAKVDADLPLEERTFVIVGTGWEIDDNMVYVGTFFEGSYVWHVMEVVL